MTGLVHGDAPNLKLKYKREHKSRARHFSTDVCRQKELHQNKISKCAKAAIS